MEKYETIEQLGEGAFAVVTKAKDLNTGIIVAIKKLKKKYQTWQECVDLREVKSLNVLKKNENIIKLKEMIRVEDTLHLVFEYMERNLLELIISRQSKKFSEGQIRCAMWQTLQGLAYMHKYGFFHRDLKPENLLVCGDTVKIADFGLAREIRSLPPYTDYVSTRYYRAPECILKSTNYNSPIDIWALGCIMIEMYNHKPIFIGNSEKEVLFRICSVLGTPNNTTWPEGVGLAKKIDLKFPTSPGIPLSQIIPDASKEVLDFLSNMLKWDPNKRATASDLLQHPYFTKFPTPTRISTPDYNNASSGTTKNVKTYSNINRINNNSSQSEIKIKTDFELDKSNRKEETDFSRLLNDTKGFNEFLQKIKNEKQEEDLKFIENKNCSPIAKRIEEEFDFDYPTYYKDNQSIVDNKTIYSNNSILNANISNITGMGSSASVLAIMNNNIPNQNTIYNYNKNFFDTTTLNNINGSGSRHGSLGGSNHGSNDKEIIDIGVKDTNEDLFQNSRRKNQSSNVVNVNLENQNNEVIKKDMKDLDFDDCNVYLKNNNFNSENPNRPSSRKRSAFKFIESTLDKASPTVNLINSVKSTKDPLNDKLSNLGSQFNNFNLKNNPGLNNGSFKNSITSTNAINAISSNTANINNLNNLPVDKKPEYQSRRKNQPTNILNELDNPKVVDININSNFSNKREIDKIDHSNVGFRKNNNNSNFGVTKEMIVADNTYKKGVGGNNFNTGTSDTSGLGLFNSRRNVNNTNTINSLSVGISNNNNNNKQNTFK